MGRRGFWIREKLQQGDLFPAEDPYIEWASGSPGVRLAAQSGQLKATVSGQDWVPLCEVMGWECTPEAKGKIWGVLLALGVAALWDA